MKILEVTYTMDIICLTVVIMDISMLLMEITIMIRSFLSTEMEIYPLPWFKLIIR